jgi:2-dehydropantoate 2-reductase
MKFVVVGAGAIGAYAGALLQLAGEDVTLIARGPHLRAMQEHGVRLQLATGNLEARPRVIEDVTQAGIADAILLTLKAHSLTEMAPRISPILGPNTTVVTMQNGIPWWYFYRHGGEWEGTHLESVDPGGIIEKHIDSARIVGSVVYIATIISEPGVVKHIEGNRVSIGEPDGSKSDRCRLISDALGRAGLRCPVRSDIRQEIWVKLMGNLAFNPISALTGATLLEIIECPETRALASSIMREVETMAATLGIDLGISIEQRIAGAARVGHHKTSMLQDVESGRPIELEAIAGAVVELGQKLGIDVPYSQSVYACARLLAATLLTRPKTG